MVNMTESLNTRILWRWSLYCILGCVLLPNLVMSSRYLPTRRSIPTQLERNERLKELFEHILESERDAHLSAASKYADQLNKIQKTKTGNDLYLLTEPMDNFDKRNFDDQDDSDDYDERPQYENVRKQTHFHHRQQPQQPWRIEFQNYARGLHRNDGLKNGDSSLQHNDRIASSMTSLNLPRSHALLQKIQNANERPIASISTASAAASSSDNTDLNNDLNWLASNYDMHGINNDYDAYDDVNENRRSSSLNRKFDHYRQNGNNLKQRSVTQLPPPKIRLD